MAQTPRPADAVRIGQVFLGKYRIESILGQGGMGVVAECTHLQLNQRLAIKMLRQDVLLDQDAVQRFMREAQAAAKLKSEYVAHVSDVGTLENGTPYMVMEYLEGHDLGALITERGKLALQWTCELMLQTAEALAEAHSHGIVHRDIKPTNLFVTWRPDGTALIKVLDFGISKTTMGTDMHLTQTQSLLGTPAYMSPEQMRSARLVDARTDIWSLGSVMYELLEGRKPFEAESFSEMCVKVAVDPPSPMTVTPYDLQQVVMRCLAKSPDQRYSTMADFARDLVPFVADPHQASLLVERMQRMLRRSNDNWDVGTGAGQRSVPNHVRDGASQPVMVPWRGDGSQPNVVVPRTSMPGVPVARPTSVEPSAPAHSPTELFGAPKRKRGALLFALVATLVVGGAGIAIALSMGGKDKPAETEAAKPATTDVKPVDVKPIETKDVKAADTTGVKTGDVKAAETKDTTTGDVKTGDVKAADTKAADTKAADTKANDTAAQTQTTTTGTQKAGTQKVGTQRIGTQKTGTQKTGTQKTTTAAPKDVPKETPKEMPKTQPDCDIYAHPHGCPH